MIRKIIAAILFNSGFILREAKVRKRNYKDQKVIWIINCIFRSGSYFLKIFAR